MDDLQRILVSAGGGLIIGAFVGGLVLRIAGGMQHRPFWKAGVRLSAGAIAALPIVAGVALLTSPSWRGDLWWLALITVPAGILLIAAGIVGIRYVARTQIPDGTGRAIAD